MSAVNKLCYGTYAFLKISFRKLLELELFNLDHNFELNKVQNLPDFLFFSREADPDLHYILIH